MLLYSIHPLHAAIDTFPTPGQQLVAEMQRQQLPLAAAALLRCCCSATKIDLTRSDNRKTS